VVDTTGAGDAFIGAALYKIMQEGINIDCISEAQAYSIIKFANIVAALTCSKKGAISALPNINEVEALLKNDYR
jgi:fructokinase